MYDMIIIGGGAAGLSAAWTARENGVEKIIILEARNATGGNSAMAGGFIYALETRHLQNRVCNDVNHELKAALDFHHYDLISPPLIRRWLDETRHTISWLESRGFEFRISDLGEGYTHLMADSPGVGWFHKVLTPLAKELTDKGVEIKKKTIVREIVLDGEGKVCGVKAGGETGEELLRGKSVLLSCGGFMNNRESLRKHFPSSYSDDSFFNVLPSPANGIDLAKSAGAKLAPECTLLKETGMCFKGSPNAPGRIFAMDGTVLVNSLGRRFVDESLWNRNYSANALLSQPDKAGYAIYSRETLEAVMNSVEPFDFRRERDKYLDYIDKASSEGELCKYCETLDELALWIGADPAVLTGTVTDYNGYCAAGLDTEFMKPAKYLTPLVSGPYLAVRLIPMYIDTIGPVIVDEHMRVLDDGHKHITGFYAAGVIASGWEGRDYMRFGSALSFSLTSGRMAGKSIAQFLQ